MTRLVLLVATVLLLAAAVHITVILWIPRLAPASAFGVLYNNAPQGHVDLIEEAEKAKDRPPYLDPYLPIGVCRFDLAGGPHRITANLQSPYWAFSIHRENGAYFYGLTHTAAIDGKLSIELRDPGQTRELTVDPDSNLPDIVQLSVPFTRGYIIIRALAQTPSTRPSVVAALKTTECAPVPAE
ncbi:MAG: hypothetical protein KDJ55_03970 [Rhodobiaceae bacterium]|nr:hypothetical protein [Rhodobiaceae bacterium]MCC0012917.1 hypothetical protein [Rhodobiaceae bacterium]MCC0018962.1 hypothetical protein [Rhodobiaceae bacterium]MCC0051097.1 hypothetical protein [Rhodobiaceae bacterium]MCC0060056.1 hypothetical protein [Rhodobiaceae bacterium]